MLRSVQAIYKRNCSTTQNIKEKWDLLAAVCIERKPIIAPLLNDIEKEYGAMLANIEYTRSLKNDHELRHEAEVKKFEQLKSGGEETDDISLKLTAQDFVDASMEELSKFKFADLKTDDDKRNNVKSMNRKLEKNLVLTLGQKLGEKKLYLLPQDLRRDGETLRQSAERILKESCGDLSAQIYGNAPAGFYKYRYPKSVRQGNGAVGAKIFMYYARYLKGNLEQESKDFKWLDREELTNILPKSYNKSLKQFLIEE